MNDAEKHEIVQQIGMLMSEISESCYYAGWLGGTEYLVPELCRRVLESDRSQPWGHGTLTPSSARRLIALSERAGCWADLDERGVGYVPFTPFPIPPQYLEALDQERCNHQFKP